MKPRALATFYHFYCNGRTESIYFKPARPHAPVDETRLPDVPPALLVAVLAVELPDAIAVLVGGGSVAVREHLEAEDAWKDNDI